MLMTSIHHTANSLCTLFACHIFAAEIFHDLHEEVMATATRGHGLIVRVKQLEAEVPLIEKVPHIQQRIWGMRIVSGLLLISFFLEIVSSSGGKNLIGLCIYHLKWSQAQA